MANQLPPAFLLPWGTTPDGRPVMLTPQAQGMLQSLLGGGSGGPVAWSDITGIPANVSSLAALAGGVDKIPYFIFAGTLGVTAFTAFGQALLALNSYTELLDAVSPLSNKGDLLTYDGTHNVRFGAGADGQVLTADSTQPDGIKWAPGAGGLPPPYLPLSFYGAIENGVHDDAPAISAWLADTAYSTTWISGVAANSLSTPRLLNKRARGGGNYHFTGTGDWLPAQFLWMTVKPATGVAPIGSSNYQFSGDLSQVDAHFTILGRLVPGGNIRRSLTENYYESVTTPHWEQFNNLVGWSASRAG